MQNSQNSRFGGTGGFNQTQGSISGNPASLKGKLMNLEVGSFPRSHLPRK